MASTQYTTIVYLLRDCPFDNTYQHTLKAMPQADKLTWLKDNCTYTEAKDKKTGLMMVKLDSSSDSGTLRLEVDDDRAFGYNYCYIDFNGKGYNTFCFITGCRYINDGKNGTGNNTSGLYEFDLEIDLLMTNILDDLQLKTCFVERMHAKNDAIYGNIEPEPISISEHYLVDSKDVIVENSNGNERKTFHPAYARCVVGIADAEHTDYQNGVLSGVTLYQFSVNDPASISNIKTLLRNHSGEDHEKDIVIMYMFPGYLITDYYNQGVSGEGVYISGSKNNVSYQNLILPSVRPYNQILRENYYEPKNKKLYSYPYRYSVLTTHEGNEVLLRDEFFAQGKNNRMARMYISVAPSPTLKVIPVEYGTAAYSQLGNWEGEGWNYALTITNFPMCSWAYSAYDQFIASSFLYSIKRAGGLKNYLADFQHTGERMLSDLF